MHVHDCSRHPAHLTYRDCPAEVWHRHRLVRAHRHAEFDLIGAVLMFALLCLLVMVTMVWAAGWLLVTCVRWIFRRRTSW
jgi:hypothetical protein